jgi:hypothetical protein
MAESRDFRAQFWTKSAIFTAILLGILVVLSLVGDNLSRFKADYTEDQLHTLTDATKNILSKLEDSVVVTYYVSEELPSVLVNLRRDTVDMLEEMKRLSDGNLEYKIVNPESEALKFAKEKAAAYKASKEANETPEEPKPRETIQDLFTNRGRPKKTDEDIAKERRQVANAIAAKSGRDEDEVYDERLRADWKNVYLQDLQEEGVFPLSFSERRGSVDQEISFFSGIEVNYQDLPAEVFAYYELHKFELELATRIVKLTTVEKPKIAFFDARAPKEDPPPMSPFNQQPQGPQSDYMQVVMALQEIFDVRTIKLKDGDTLDELVKEVDEDSESGGGLSCFIVAQPDALEPRQVYEISKAVSSGVPTIFLVSRNSVNLVGQRSEQSEIQFFRSGLDDYFRTLGFSLGHDILASNSCSTLPILRKMGGLGHFPAAHPFAVTVLASTRDRTLSEEISLTNGVPALVFPATNGLTLHGEDLKKFGIHPTKIAWTHEHTWAVSVPPITQNPFGQGASAPTLIQYQKDLIDRKRSSEHLDGDFVERRELAVMFEGKFPFFFQGKEVPEWEPEPEASEGGAPGGFPGGFPGGLPGGLPPGLQLPGGPRGSGGPAGPEATPEATPAPAGDAGDAAAAPDEAAPDEAAPDEAAPDEAAPDEAAPDEAAPDEAAAEEEKAPEPVIADLTPVDGKILVLASVDVLKDKFLTQRSRDYNANLMFVRNVLETFGRSDDLLALRVKERTQRNFEPGTDESKVFWIQAINIAIVPMLIGLLGLARYLIRRV